MATRTTSSLFSPAAAYWNQREQVAKALPRLQSLSDAIDRSVDLTPSQIVQWYAATIEFKPDLIIEFGRAFGNSTAVFTQAANDIGNCRVVSVCLMDLWRTQSVPKIAKLVEPGWFDPLDARVQDIRTLDIEQILPGANRVLFLWDAHGFGVANFVLAKLFPLLAEKQNLVLMHDITDCRYKVDDNSYHGKPIWHGGNDGTERMRIAGMDSGVGQFISILDFTYRNAIALKSGDESLHEELTTEQAAEMARLLGSSHSLIADWYFLSLNDRVSDRPLVFPSNVEDLRDMDTLQREVDDLKHELRIVNASVFWKLRSVVHKLLGRGYRKA